MGYFHPEPTFLFEIKKSVPEDTSNENIIATGTKSKPLTSDAPLRNTEAA